MRAENTPRLETERLILRKFKPEDVWDAFLIYRDKEINRFLPWHPVRSIREMQEFFEKQIFPEYEKEGAYRYALEEKETHQVIGYLKLVQIDLQARSGALGYGLRREFWNRGLMIEAARALLSRLREDGFRVVTAAYDQNNPRSGRVLEKLGMRYIRSYEEQWQPKDFKVTFLLYQIDF